MEIQRLLARGRLAFDQLPGRQRPDRQWACGPRRRHLRQDHRQRHPERDQRALRLGLRPAAGHPGLLHELHAGYYDAGWADEEAQIEVALVNTEPIEKSQTAIPNFDVVGMIEMGTVADTTMPILIIAGDLRKSRQNQEL